MLNKLTVLRDARLGRLILPGGIFLLAGCAAPPAGFRPLPQLRAATLPRAEAGTNYAAPAFLGVIPWQLPPDATNFCWQLQASTNLVDWTDLPSLCLTDPVTVTASNACRFVRLKGTP